MESRHEAEAEELCASVGVIRDGQLLAVAPPDQLRRSAASPVVEVLGNGFCDSSVAGLRALPDVDSVERSDGKLLVHLHRDIDVAPIVALLVKSGAQIREVSRGKASACFDNAATE